MRLGGHFEPRQVQKSPGTRTDRKAKKNDFSLAECPQFPRQWGVMPDDLGDVVEQQKLVELETLFEDEHIPPLLRAPNTEPLPDGMMLVATDGSGLEQAPPAFQCHMPNTNFYV